MQTLDFVRSVVHDDDRFSGRSHDGATVLDHGCGHGRIAGLFHDFVDPSRFHAVDPGTRRCASAPRTD